MRTVQFGLGRHDAIARAITAHGTAVIISGRSQARSEATAERLVAEDVSARGIACDVTDPASIAAFAAAALACYGHVDTLILNAARPTPPGFDTKVQRRTTRRRHRREPARQPRPGQRSGAADDSQAPRSHHRYV